MVSLIQFRGIDYLLYWQVLTQLDLPTHHVQPSLCDVLTMTSWTALTLSLGPFGPRTRISGSVGATLYPLNCVDNGFTSTTRWSTGTRLSGPLWWHSFGLNISENPVWTKPLARRTLRVLCSSRSAATYCF